MRTSLKIPGPFSPSPGGTSKSYVFHCQQVITAQTRDIFRNLAGAENDEDKDETVPLAESTVARMVEAHRQCQEIHRAAHVAADIGDLLLNGGFPLTDDV